MPACAHRRARGRHEGAHRPRRTATASRPARGPTCCATASAAACAPLCSPSVTAHSGSGARCGRSSPRPASSAAGSTRSATYCRRCPSPPSPAAKKAMARDLERRGPRPRPTRRRRVRSPTAPSSPRPSRRSSDDQDELLAFYDFPAEHWIHLRTTNPIESTFATVRHREQGHQRPGSKAAGVAIAFKLIEAAQARWRAVNAPHLVALVRAGATFKRGKLVERATHTAQAKATAEAA